MAKIDEVLVEVEEQTTVIDSAITLLKNIKALLDAAGTDPAKLDEIKNALDTNTKKLADAVVANTPAEPVPPEPTPPVE